MNTRARRPTLTLRLMLLVLGSLAVVWVAFVFIAYRTSQTESVELADGQLASVVALMLNEQHPDLSAAGGDRPQPRQNKSANHDYQQTLTVMIWDASGRRITSLGTAPAPGFEEATGYANLRIGTPPTNWRSFSQWDVTRSRKVMAMLNLDERDRVAQEFASEMAVPGLLVLPAVALALGLAIWSGLRPLYRLSDDVTRLDVHGGDRLPDRNSLREFESVVTSINTLVRNQAATLDRERQLAGEVAHELRTPLSSMALNAHALREPLTPEKREQALVQIERDALRAGHVLDQLLSLARASRSDLQKTAEPVDLPELTRHIAAECAQAAWDSGHEISVHVPAYLTLRGHPLLMELAISNLVSNALQHTPRGTAVEIQAGQDDNAVWVRVCDDGKRAGAPPVAERRHKSADRLGLGHNIVRRVMDIHDGQFEQMDAPPPFTTCYGLVFPAGGRVAPGKIA